MAKALGGFSEAARLYAENAEIVDAMFQIFYEDMQAFADVLESAIEKEFPDGLFRHTLSKNIEEVNGRPRYRFWSLGPDNRVKRRPYLFLDTWDTKLVNSGSLWLGASAPSVSRACLTKLWQIPKKKRFSDFCSFEAKRKWEFFWVDVPISGKGALGAAAKKIARVLREMHRIYTGKRV